ncbi:MAG: histidinol dehydrogenase [Gammaproteobacteria bacterium]|nr:histidinol dehydrogenase [Gammaproteobacteria bacterium]MDH5240486.1 histidinol dehydrogenase [Gammaproteobacteria bacterium]MDH5260344.1 histidinol dehydrogenase [Gammaproteobacteria bacterium]MDH5583247.1 histidinol dehydrogenase [Gammaproteobacteria bacterium]
MNIPIHQWQDLSEQQRSLLLRRPAVSQDDSVRASAVAIIAAVRQRGDLALAEFTAQFDGAGGTEFRVTEAEFASAAQQLAAEDLAAIDLAIANIRRFHEQQLPAPVSLETMPGVLCERISQPIDSVGLYVPAGTAPLPSAAIMLAVPATIARCPRIILCTPPRPDGTADPAVLVAASRAGVAEIYKVGGAQAIAAMAYGTATIPKVRKIFGPGNPWVTSAKTIVSADPDGAAIDMPAGPSEVLVIADAVSSPEFVAADLLSQAEHGVDSQVVLVTTDAAQATSVQVEITRQLESLSRSDIAASALENSLFIVAPDVAAAIEISNRYAPEHLILQIENPRAALSAVRNAGSVFVGRWTPESVGDYCSGTNHVLPTYGYAATYSGLGIDQFLRQMTVQELTRDGLENLGAAVIRLAGLEGLDAHAAAVSRRLATKP